MYYVISYHPGPVWFTHRENIKKEGKANVVFWLALFACVGGIVQYTVASRCNVAGPTKTAAKDFLVWANLLNACYPLPYSCTVKDFLTNNKAEKWRHLSFLFIYTTQWSSRMPTSLVFFFLPELLGLETAPNRPQFQNHGQKKGRAWKSRGPDGIGEE